MIKQYTFSTFIITLFIFLAFGSTDTQESSKNSNSTYTPNSQSTDTYKPCYGSERCINKVRVNFANTGKQILGEQYLGNGKFGISFLDVTRGEVYNADVTTDCNCAINNVRVSLVR
jgi:hypothetical protein